MSENKDVVVEPFEVRVKRYLDGFEMTQAEMLELVANMDNEVLKCKKRHKNRQPRTSMEDMHYLDTCVKKMPSGNEKGVYYAVDFGGSNIRAVRVELDGEGGLKSDQVVKEICNIKTNQPRGLKDAKTTATELFDNIALIVKELMEKHGELNAKTPFPCGFCFSFAFRSYSIDRAESLTMQKGFETGKDTDDPVMGPGSDIGLMLSRAFERAKMPAYTAAVLNDTTGTLIAGAYTRPKNWPPCQIGAIVGTGLNMCYVDPEAQRYGYIGSVIGTECGAYGKELKRVVADFEVDFADATHGHFMEKMISGMYLGEICRRTILKVFQAEAPAHVWYRGYFPTKFAMAVAYDQKPFDKTKEILEQTLRWTQTASPLDARGVEVVHLICRAVVDRAAALLAVMVNVFGKNSGLLQPAVGGLTVAIDGSVYLKNKDFQKTVNEKLEELLGTSRKDLIHFHIAQDGSGIGAAILAAMSIKAHSPTTYGIQQNLAPSPSHTRVSY